jgi:hypothetical protein
MLAASGAHAQDVAASGYLCCNLRLAGARASDGNAPRAGDRILPAGTKLTGLQAGEWQLDAQLDGRPIVIANDTSRGLSMADFARRWIVAKDPTPELAKWTPRIRRAITTGRLVNGMNRKQVLMSLGWPTTSATPDLQALSWTYPAAGGKSYRVVFNEAWLVKAVEGDGATRAAVLLPAREN